MATTTPRLKFTLPAANEQNWYQSLNGNFSAIDSMASLGNLAVVPAECPSASLNIQVSPGMFNQLGGARFAYAGGTVAVPASATTCVWLTDSGRLATGPTWPDPIASPCVVLATVYSSATAITSVADQRIGLRSSGVLAPPTIAGTANQVLVTSTPNSITLATPQAIDPTAAPTFASVSLTAAPGANQAAPRSYVDAAISAVATAVQSAQASAASAGNAASAAQSSANAAASAAANAQATATSALNNAATANSGVVGNAAGIALKAAKAGDAFTGPIQTAGQGPPLRLITASATSLATDEYILIDATAASVTLTLSVPTSGTQELWIKRRDNSLTNNVVITAVAKIAGSLTSTLTSQGQVLHLIYGLGTWTTF